MRKQNVAILGATGAVGREILTVLEERKFPINNLLLLTSERNAGKEIVFAGEKFMAVEASKGNFSNIDIVLGAVSSELSRIYSPLAVEKGAVVIDNSSAYRLDENVPLVIPEINSEDVSFNKGIIASPNCTTTIILVAVNKLNEFSKIKRMVASTYQAVSGAGADAVKELERQTAEFAAGKTVAVNILNHRILHNLIPHIDDFTENGYTKEEMKLVNESRKILHSPDIKISCTCVRVPVFRCHSASVTLEFEKEVTAEKASELLNEAPGVRLVDDVENGVYPMPVNSSGFDDVRVGRVRQDLSGSGISLWCCGDQLRKGAATNTVQIAELVLEQRDRNGGRP